MNLVTIAAILYGAATLVAVGFLIALALGAPWGSYTMGGRFPGRLPAPMRGAALVQGFILSGLVVIVLSRAGVAASGLTTDNPWLIWLVVVVAAISLVLNLITPSAGERKRWAPVAFTMLVSSLIVALRF